MSLNRTLDRLFTEIRREAKRNPAFADRLDAVLGGHASGRSIDEANLEPEETADALEQPSPAAHPTVNPVAILQKEGEAGLKAALAQLERSALAALIAEHNLDPAGAAADGDASAMRAQILAQAGKRLNRDKKLFDY